MQTTTNYGLKTYQSGDLFNPLTVENYNSEKLDTEMKAIDDRTIGRATELVSQGVHAITLIDTDCKTFKFIATGNYTAGETFTVNGIQTNAYLPSGTPLSSDAFVTGAVVLASLNSDNSAITIYVTGTSTADNSLKLGDELPSYYAKQSDMTNAENDIDNLQNLIGNNSIVGIGDGTVTGGVVALNNNVTENKWSSGYDSTAIEYSLTIDVPTAGCTYTLYIPKIALVTNTLYQFGSGSNFSGVSGNVVFNNGFTINVVRVDGAVQSNCVLTVYSRKQ